MSEEEVEKKLAKMNQEIYINKLLKDLDQNYANLKIVFENLINLFNNEILNRTYEIYLDCDNFQSRDIASDKIKGFFNTLKDYMIKKLEDNKKALSNVVVLNDYVKYVNQIQVLTNELYSSLNELYLSNADKLIEDISAGLDDFSKNRLITLVREIVYNRFMNKVKESISNVNLLLMNNYQENNDYLEHMNEKTGVVVR